VPSCSKLQGIDTGSRPGHAVSAWCIAFIGLGSNLGESRELLRAAWTALGERPGIVLHSLSSPYRTRPTGMDSPNWFINAAGMLRTTLGPDALLAVLHETEHRFGRIRSPDRQGYQDRTLDLDLLLLDGQVLRNGHLTLPHPALHQRMFVLAPLAEIAPQMEHPVLRKTIAQLLAELSPQADLDDIELVRWQDPCPLGVGRP